MPLSQFFTNSEMSTYKDCKRKWYLGNYRKLSKRSHWLSPPLSVGTLVHEAVRVFYRNNGDTELALKWLDRQKQKEVDLALVADKKQVHENHELARTVFEGYAWWLENTGADHRLTIEAVEKAFDVAGPVDGTRLLGKIDMLARDNVTDEVVLLDHKTLDAFARTVQTLNLNEQGPFYALIRSIAEPEAKPVTKIIWNMMRKVKRGPKSKPPYYARKEIYITKPMLSRLWDQIYGQIRDIHETEARLDAGEDHNIVAYPHPTQDCHWKCPFFGVCGLMNDPSSHFEDILDNAFEITDPLQRYQDQIEESL